MGRRKKETQAIQEPQRNHPVNQVILKPKNIEQKQALTTIINNVVTFIKGAPGSGKTYLAVAHGLQKLLEGEYKHLVFTRPVVEASGEKLGFLPGRISDKIDPFMTPIFETLYHLLPEDIISNLIGKTKKYNSQSVLRIIPLAYMRGITLNDSYIVVDESQNCKPEQIRMILTRLGEKSKMVFCGDVYQSDINTKNGLTDAFELLQDIEGIGFVTLSEDAIVRHPIVKAVEQRYLARGAFHVKENKLV